MPQRTDSFDLQRLGLTSGEGRRLDLHVHVEPFSFGAQTYAAEPDVVPVRLDVSRTTGSGWALRLRYGVAVSGPCMRCLEAAEPRFEVDAREVEQPGAGDDQLSSPYVGAAEGELDVAAWARDALALSLPTQITCRLDCAGLCAQCGANLNDDPDHAHEAEPDQRWAKLSEIRFD
ncbi:MAG: YceD family protein [Solirubrobacteraceae bacterium]